MNLVRLFSTPVWQEEFPNFSKVKDEWLTHVRKYIEDNPESLELSNVGGYHSPQYLHTIPELRDLFNYICFQAKDICNDLGFKEDVYVYVKESWVNVSGKSSFHREHVHGEVLSGVFYIKTPLESGRLNFVNTGMNKMWGVNHLIREKNNFTADGMSVDPVEGFLFMWPSYLPHSVDPNQHDEERISISFNVTISDEEL